ncbi:MAG: exodeoxyribonuclease VII small subunit [Bacilli bacterium]
MEFKKDLSKLSYEELEKEADLVLTELNKNDISLDMSTKVYEYGKKIAKAMDSTLKQLQKEVTDTVE